MGFWLGHGGFLALVKVAGALDAFLGDGGILALVKVSGALDGVLAG
jgi:hypothetical protein